SGGGGSVGSAVSDRESGGGVSGGGSDGVSGGGSDGSIGSVSGGGNDGSSGGSDGDSAGPRPLRVMELFSGVGGLHYAVRLSGAPAAVVAALDVSDVANAVYRRNFPRTTLLARSLESLPDAALAALRPDALVAGPPCQPFARRGRRLGLDDRRCAGLARLVALLRRLGPRYLLLENVAGFEGSGARRALHEALDARGGYAERQEFLLGPAAVGVPNSRLRYFLVARRGGGPGFQFRAAGGVMNRLPADAEGGGAPSPLALLPAGFGAEPWQGGGKEARTAADWAPPPPPCSYKSDAPAEAARKMAQDRDANVRSLREFLDPDDDDDEAAPRRYARDSLLVPPRVLRRYGRLLDIVTPDSRRSNCFTGAYGRYVEGSGSVLLADAGANVAAAFREDEEEEGEEGEERTRRLAALGLRYFSPGEVARIHGFPDGFSFPEGLSLRKRWQLLGNSVNVRLVAELLRLTLR
uniref:tRNA (Cytosine(38)-C(5))-methyltransferase n=1 Tax=Petromyzon marinus TaxID=7757 RepID=A0AAJ7XJB3_PETMA